MIDERTIATLATKLHAAKPASDEGDLALAAWRRAVYAFADTVVPMKVHAHFVNACERGGELLG